MQPLFNDEQIKAIRAIVQEEMDKAKVRLMGGVTDAEYAECKEEWNNDDEQTRALPKFDFIREYEAAEEKRRKERKEKLEREEKEREARGKELALQKRRERLNNVLP
jgi:hypothetical protein